MDRFFKIFSWVLPKISNSTIIMGAGMGYIDPKTFKIIDKIKKIKKLKNHIPTPC